MRPKRPCAVSGRTWTRGERKPFQAKSAEGEGAEDGELSFDREVGEGDDEGESGAEGHPPDGDTELEAVGFGAYGG